MHERNIIGPKIRQLRESREMTVEELAVKLVEEKKSPEEEI
ncbi:MAG: hypothetical protein Q8N08_02355 [Methanobacteriaceae archaeon]|nr:hypothetical protein [Methanobacteriaceae archaeon]